MQKRIEAVVAYVERDLRQQVLLSEVASLVNLSPSRLRHLFKEETGMSVKQYQKQLRLLKAKELLEDTFLSIKEIMLETGIMDRKYFTRSFREMFGTNPSQYRRLVTAQSQPEQPKALASSAALAAKQSVQPLNFS